MSLTSDRDTLPTDEELRLCESTAYSQSEIVDPDHPVYGVVLHIGGSALFCLLNPGSIKITSQPWLPRVSR